MLECKAGRGGRNLIVGRNQEIRKRLIKMPVEKLARH
jgi:hypothetical protein